MLANWQQARTPDDAYADLAKQCADQSIAAQRSDGAWEYPNPEWKSRIATVEGIWASLGLMLTFERTGDSRYLDAVLKWDRFLRSQIGFQSYGDGVAVNYFANQIEHPVPNNSALALRYFACLNRCLSQKDDQAEELCEGMIRFLSAVQMESGELPYEVDVPSMKHFQCFQYHGFILLDLLEYFRISNDKQAEAILLKIAKFLCEGVLEDGSVRYQIGNERKRIHYHAMVVAAALKQVSSLCGNLFSSEEKLTFANHYERIVSHLCSKQRSDGSLPHSTGDYRILRDQRSYPRYLAMILLHSITCLHSKNSTESLPDSESCGDVRETSYA